MILVVADTAPLRYLVEIGYEYLLPRLFTKIWIPGAVVEELRQARTPAIVRDWSSRFPSWIAVREVSGPSPGRELGSLDRGEWEAIQLAKHLKSPSAAH